MVLMRTGKPVFLGGQMLTLLMRGDMQREGQWRVVHDEPGLSLTECVIFLS